MDKIRLKVISTGSKPIFKRPKLKEAFLQQTWQSFLINDLKLKVKKQFS